MPPCWDDPIVSLAEGQVRLEEAVDAFFDLTKTRVPGNSTTTQMHLIRITAGAGKTSSVIRALVNKLNNQPELCIHLFTDRIQLAEDTKEDIEHIDPNIRVLVVKGVEKAGCLRPDVVQTAGLKGLSVYKTCCDRSPGEKTEPLSANPIIRSALNRCPFFDQCPVQTRFDKAYQVYIFPHEFLRHGVDERIPKPDYIIVDEAFLLKTLRSELVPIRDILEIPNGNRLLDALRKSDFLTRRRLLEIGLTPEILRGHASDLRKGWYARVMTLKPGTPSLGDRIQKLPDLSSVVWLCEALATDMESGREKLYSVIRRIRKGTVVHSGTTKPTDVETVVVRWRDPISFKVPTLMLDATADERLLRIPFPALEVTKIDIRRNARVVQIYDNQITKSGLRWDASGDRGLRRRINRVVDQFAPPHRCGLVITYKDFKGEVNRPDGWQIDHFGNIRGRNDFSDLECVIIVGRNLPPDDAVEDKAAGLVYGTPHKIDFESGKHEMERGYRLKSGKRRGIRIWEWKDSILADLERQMCEQETVQALDRLRLLRNASPKTVVLLCSRPVDVEVDALVPLNFLAQETVLDQAQDRAGSVLPLRDKWLTEHFPDLFGSEDAAKRAVKHEKEIMGAISDRELLSEIAPIIIRYRTKGQRGPKAALARVCGETDLEKITQRLSELHNAPVTLYARHITCSDWDVPPFVANSQSVFLFDPCYAD